MSDDAALSLSRTQLIAVAALLVVALAGTGLYALLAPDHRQARITKDYALTCTTVDCIYEVDRISDRYAEGTPDFYEAMFRLQRSGVIVDLEKGPITILGEFEDAPGVYKARRDGEIYWVADSEFQFVESP